MAFVMEMEELCWRLQQMTLLIANRCALEAVNMCHMQPKVPCKVVALAAQIATMGEIL